MPTRALAVPVLAAAVLWPLGAWRSEVRGIADGIGAIAGVVLDRDGRPAEGVSVWAILDGPLAMIVPRTVFGRGGTFRLGSLLPGRITLFTADEKNGFPDTRIFADDQDLPTTVEVLANIVVGGVQVTLPRKGGVLRATVDDALTGRSIPDARCEPGTEDNPDSMLSKSIESNGSLVLEFPSITGHVFDSSGQALPGVSVTAMLEGGGIAADATTDRGGAYRFDALPDGAYRVDFEVRGFDIIRRNAVRVEAGTPADRDAELPISSICECVSAARPTDICGRAGRVMNESGHPLPHARLEIVSPTRRESAFADGAGRFQFCVPVPGGWPLTASDGGFRSVTQKVSARNAAPIVFTLPHIVRTDLPDTEHLRRPCRCPGDLFTHDGR